MNSNSPEDRLLAELLREQAKGSDEAFLKQIEAAVDAGPPIAVRRHVPRNLPKFAIAAGLGLAAAISFFFYLEKRDFRKSANANHLSIRERTDEKAKAALESQGLNQAIREQEDKVEERRKVLASIAATKNVAHQGQDSSYGQPGVDQDQIVIHPQEELVVKEAGAKRGLNEQNYASDTMRRDEGFIIPEAESASANKADVAFNWHSSPRAPRPRIVPPAASVIIGGNAPAKSRAAGNEVFGRQSDFSRDAASEQAGGDRYGKFIDQPWKSPSRDPLSTFSIDVDTASYSNVRRMIQEGREIPKDAVRIEEFINAFKYSYATPKGDGPFAVSATLAACPWAPTHQLVRVAIKGREIEANKRPASNLVFLIDVSGSMQSPDRLPLLKQSMATLVEQLDERDRVAIVVYAGTEGVALASTRLDAEGRATVLKALGKLEAGGSTNGGAGIKRAYELAMKEKTEGGVNRVILATDGDFNVGVTGQNSLVELVKERAKGGVYLTVLGFGSGNLNDTMMDAITRDGNGNYFYIDSEREGRKVFLQNLSGTLVTIAKDVKIQVEFNPAKVGSYRLIGYSNRVLRNEDFSNDKVDAGDIGAGHTVTAFYELTPPGTEGLKYQSAATDEWLTVKLRHKHPDGDESRLIEFPLTGGVPALDKTDADFQFATAAALYGMKLRGMAEVKDFAWEKVLELAKPGLANDAAEDRAEFVGLVNKLRGGKGPNAGDAEVVPVDRDR